MDIERDALLGMYRRMVRIREFELAAIDLFKRGAVKGTVHPYIGQEASGVGVCMRWFAWKISSPPFWISPVCPYPTASMEARWCLS